MRKAPRDRSDQTWSVASSRHLASLPEGSAHRRQLAKARRLLAGLPWWHAPIAGTPARTVQTAVDGLATIERAPASVSLREAARTLLHACDPTLRLTVAPRPRALPHVLSPTELMTLRDDEYSTRWQLGFQLAVGSAEALALTASDVVDWPSTDTLALNLSGPRARTIPIPASTQLACDLRRLRSLTAHDRRLFDRSDTTDARRFAALIPATPRTALTDTATLRLLQASSPAEAALITGLDEASLRQRYGPLAAGGAIRDVLELAEAETFIVPRHASAQPVHLTTEEGTQ